MEENRHKVIIIGSGPAGLTAAIYTSRANLNPLLIEGNQPGGQLTITTGVDNYPGFSEGIQGPQLMAEMKKQAQRFGTNFLSGEAEDVDFSNRPFTIKVNDKNYKADSIIIASGATARFLGLESEKMLIGFGVSTCATCDGYFYKDKEVAVVGGGDSAVEESLFLTKFATKVYIIHRRNQLRATKIMQDKAFKSEKIEILWDSIITEILGEKETGVTGVKLKNVKTGEISEKMYDGVFLAIGHIPNTEIFKNKLELDENGYIKTFNATQTSIKGVFAAGDVVDKVYRQAISAAGTGCMAALDAERFLESEKI